VKKYAKIFFGLLFVAELRAQDMYFVCFQRSLLNHNPAFAGCSGKLRAQVAQNVLWPGLGARYNSFAGVDSYVGNGSSVGLSWSRQQEATVQRRFDVSAYYCNRISLFNKKIIVQPGISVSYAGIRANWNKLQFGDEIDPNLGFVYESNEIQGLRIKTGMDFNAGLLIFNKSFFSGISVLHILQHDEAFLGGPDALHMRIGFQGGGNILLNKMISLHPSLQFATQMDSQFGSLGCSALFKNWQLGFNFSTNKSISVVAGWQNKRLAAGISHSIFFKGIPYATSFGAFEFTFSYNFMTVNSERKFVEVKGF
jgi:type IX secretion system PorP/SprF family membrane protein